MVQSNDRLEDNLKKGKKEGKQDKLYVSHKRYPLNSETKRNSNQRDGKRCIMQTVIIRK